MSPISTLPNITSGALQTISSKLSTHIKEKICYHLNEGINNFQKQKVDGEHVQKAAAQQALGTVGIGVGALGLAGVISLGVANPLTLGITLVAVGSVLLGLGSIHVFKNVKKANPDLPLYQQLYKTCTQSVKNILYGSTNLILEASTKLREKFVKHARSYQTKITTKKELIDIIKTNINNVKTKVQNAPNEIREEIERISQSNELNLSNAIDTLANSLAEQISKDITKKLEQIKTKEKDLSDIINYIEPYKSYSKTINDLFENLNNSNIPDYTKLKLFEELGKPCINEMVNSIIEEIKKGETNILTQLEKTIGTDNENLRLTFKTVKTFVTTIKEITTKIQQQGEKAIKNCKQFIQEGNFERARHTLCFLGEIVEKTNLLTSENLIIQGIQTDELISLIDTIKLTDSSSIQTLDLIVNHIKSGTLHEHKDVIDLIVNDDLKQKLKERIETEKAINDAIESLEEQLKNFPGNGLKNFVNITDQNALKEQLLNLTKNTTKLQIMNVIDSKFCETIKTLSNIINEIERKTNTLELLGCRLNGITNSALQAIKLKIQEWKNTFTNTFYNNLNMEKINMFSPNFESMNFSIDENLVKNLETSFGRHIETGITSTLEAGLKGAMASI